MGIIRELKRSRCVRHGIMSQPSRQKKSKHKHKGRARKKENRSREGLVKEGSVSVLIETVNDTGQCGIGGVSLWSATRILHLLKRKLGGCCRSVVPTHAAKLKWHQLVQGSRYAIVGAGAHHSRADFPIEADRKFLNYSQLPATTWKGVHKQDDITNAWEWGCSSMTIRGRRRTTLPKTQQILPLPNRPKVVQKLLTFLPNLQKGFLDVR